jgi:hypothetical protein
MGHFYVNFTLKTTDSDDVADTLEQAGRSAFVTRPQGGCVVVFEEQTDSQDVNEIEEVGAMLSKQQKCPVLAILNHDDDILAYWLCDRGQLIDSYNSAPDYFAGSMEGDRGGDVDLLCKTLGKPAAAQPVREILEGDDYTFAFMRHGALCAALNLPEWAVGVGYRYLEEGDFPDGLSEENLRRVQ